MVQDWCREKYVWTGELSSISDNILANCSQLQSRERERERESDNNLKSFILLELSRRCGMCCVVLCEIDTNNSTLLLLPLSSTALPSVRAAYFEG